MSPAPTRELLQIARAEASAMPPAPVGPHAGTPGEGVDALIGAAAEARGRRPIPALIRYQKASRPLLQKTLGFHSI